MFSKYRHLKTRIGETGRKAESEHLANLGQTSKCYPISVVCSNEKTGTEDCQRNKESA